MIAPTAITSPWLSRHRGRILPAFHHVEYSPGGGSVALDVALPLPSRGNLIHRFFKVADNNNRIVGRPLWNPDEGGPDSIIVGNFCKDDGGSNRVRLRSQYGEAGTDPADVIRAVGGCWKEGRLFESEVDSAASSTVFTMSDDAASLGWWTNDADASPPILADTFAGYVLEWLDGANAGVWSLVSSSDGSEFTLVDAMPDAIQAGDRFALRRSMGNRVNGRVYRKPRVLFHQETGTVLPAGAARAEKYMYDHQEIRFLDLEVLDRDESVATYAPFNWFTFTSWSQVKNIIDISNPSNNVLRPVELAPGYFDTVMGKRLFVKAHPPTFSGANGDGFLRLAGSFGNPHGVHGTVNAGEAIVLGRNTVFSDSPGIPLPITYYLKGIYLEVEAFPTCNQLGHEDETGVRPWVKVAWVIIAKDGNGNVLFDPSVSPYADVLFDWAWNEGDGRYLPGRFEFWLDWGRYGAVETLHGWSYLCGRMSPCMAGQSVTPNGDPYGDWLANDLVDVPPYSAECAGWGGAYLSNADWVTVLGQLPMYSLRVEIV